MSRLPTIRPVVACLLATALAGCATAPPDPEGAWEEGPPALDAEGKADGVDLPAYAPLPEGADLDRPFEALFTPDDPVVTLELEQIRRVVAARALDPAVYADGTNPFRIRYAVYNLRNPQVTEALVEAHRAGVDVQVLIEADQLDPARDYNQMDELLVAGGFAYVPDHRSLDAAGRAGADLVGITGSGLMHLKSRLFETPEWRALLTGSMNPGDNAVMNEETLHLVRDPALFARYEAAYEAVLEGRRIPNVWDPEAAVNVLFTPSASGERAGARILRWVAEEDEQILLMVFSLRDAWGELVPLLARKVAEGVPVWVITDRKQSDGVDANGAPVAWDDDTEDRLRAVGVHVYEATNLATPFTAMHHKVAVLGRTDLRVITDAGNWTYAGLGDRTRRARNVESLLFIDSSRLDAGRTGRRYLAQWVRVLSRYAHQSAADGEPAFGEAAAALLSHEDWPSEPATFEAHADHTVWGEELYVRGNHDALGHWGTVHGGLRLSAAGTFPLWRSTETVALPVGAEIAWKLVTLRGGDGHVSWEGGDNRRLFVQGAVLRPLLAVSGRYR